MRFLDLIEQKKRGEALSKAQIQYFIDACCAEQIPDYQVSALLMAIVLKGMTREETVNLTMAMMHSGDVMDLSSIPGIKADKHSTGGVGDKTSLVLAPMAAACGLKVAKMSGRGLGHTGGTLDKLESIDGFRTDLTEAEFLNQVQTIGLAINGQTGELVPADKKLYALRDVTGTVDSIPLIASSIMSKKLASGADVIVLDVKCGEGAFMKTLEDARILGRLMCDIGEAAGRKVRVMITDMNQPLGRAIGNALEVREAIDTLRGEGPEDFTQLCMQAGSLMLEASGMVKNQNDAVSLLTEVIQNGKAFEKLAAMTKAQGGDVGVLLEPERLPKADFQTVIRSEKGGTITAMHALTLGTLAMEIGAGRATKADRIDPGVGIVLSAKVGDAVKEGDPLAVIHHQRPLTAEWMDRMNGAVRISEGEQPSKPLIYEIF